MYLEDKINVREYEQYINKKVVVLLADNRFLYGILKSYDQYNNISLNFVIERIFFKKMYAEKKRGLLAIRGENIAMIGIAEFNDENIFKIDYDVLLDRILIDNE
ncbi:hypothetical protein NUSPORA_00360 [Nucleospora cyclopteri]